MIQRVRMIITVVMIIRVFVIIRVVMIITLVTMLFIQVVPDSAVPVSGSSQQFSEYFLGKSSSSAAAAALCPVSSVSESLPPALPLTDQWTLLKKTECETNKAFCWMNCLELPGECSEREAVCRNNDDRQCCTDSVTENCANMDNTCRSAVVNMK